MTRLPICLLLLLPVTFASAAPQSSVQVSFVSASQRRGYSHTIDWPRTRNGNPRARQISLQRRNSIIPEGMTVAIVTNLDPENTADSGYYLRRPSSRLPRTFVSVYPKKERGISNNLQDPEAMWPMGVFLPPDHDLHTLHLSLDAINNQQLFEKLDGDPDPFLRTGEDAVETVKYLFSLGELFYDQYPHAEVLLRHQEERIANGLAGNKLGSIRPESPFYRWPNKPSPLFGY